MDPVTVVMISVTIFQALGWKPKKKQQPLPAGHFYATGYRFIPHESLKSPSPKLIPPHIYKDGDIIVNADRFPVMRSSYSKQCTVPLSGITIQGFPSFDEELHPDAPYGQMFDKTVVGKTLEPALVARCAVWAALVGGYGALGAMQPLPGGAPVSLPGLRGVSLPLLAGAGAVVLALTGNLLPAAVLGGVALFAGRGGGVRVRGGGYVPAPGAWQRPPGMTDEEAEAAWSEWLAANPQPGRG